MPGKADMKNCVVLHPESPMYSASGKAGLSLSLMMQMQKTQPLGFGDALKNKRATGHSLMQRTLCLLRLEIWLTVAAPLASWRALICGALGSCWTCCAASRVSLMVLMSLISRQLQHPLSRVMVPGLRFFCFLNTDFFTHGGWVGRRELGLKSAILEGRWEMKSYALVKNWYTKMKFLGVGRFDIQEK